MKTLFSRVIFISVFAIVFLFSCSKGDFNSKHNLTIAFYNVENLFDLEDEPGKMDEEFMPNSEKKWNQERYIKKLNDLSKVLSSINRNELPEIIGLCEVENKKVVEDLVKTGQLVNGKYKVVHYGSPDFRGIDCALVYRSDEFMVINSFPIKVNFKDEPNYLTRDILYVKGKTKNREEFHIFVNHWPSRIGGTEQTEFKRIEVATILKGKIDSIQTTDALANIVVLGDMNDEPSNNSLAKILMAQKPETLNADFVNLMFPVQKNGKGSYVYQGNWNMLDNIVVSKSLLDEKGFKCVDKKGFVFHEDWMEFKNKDGQISPNRTYGGPNYYGGISDHFPVYFTLQR